MTVTVQSLFLSEDRHEDVDGSSSVKNKNPKKWGGFDVQLTPSSPNESKRKKRKKKLDEGYRPAAEMLDDEDNRPDLEPPPQPPRPITRAAPVAGFGRGKRLLDPAG